jgi:hypothetical protein
LWWQGDEEVKGKHGTQLAKRSSQLSFKAGRLKIKKRTGGNFWK